MSETALEAMLERRNELNGDDVVRCDEDSFFYKPKMDVPQSSQVSSSEFLLEKCDKHLKNYARSVEN